MIEAGYYAIHGNTYTSAHVLHTVVPRLSELFRDHIYYENYNLQDGGYLVAFWQL